MIAFSTATRQSVALLVLTAAVMLGFTAETQAGSITIKGVTEGQVVTGDVFLSAAFTDQPNGIVFGVRGPKGFTTSNSGNVTPLPLVPDPVHRTQSVAWDSTQHPEGEYLAIAYSSPSRKRRTVATVRFFVKHPDPAPVAPQPPVTNPTPTETPTTETPAVEEPTNETPTTETPTTETPTAEKPATGGTPTAPQPEPAADPFTLAFATGSLTERTIGDTQDVKLDVDGTLPDNADVLIIAWHHEQRTTIESFAHVLDDAPWVIRAEMMDELPSGSVELQAHYREDGNVVRSAKYTIQNHAATAEGMPNVKFDVAAKSKHIQGSTTPIKLSLSGAMPAEGDVLLLAWSVDENQLVEGFAQAIDAGPWEVSAAQLNKLPLGEVELQALTRMDSQVKARSIKTISVTQSVASGSPDGTTDDQVSEEPDTDTETPTDGNSNPDGGVADGGNTPGTGNSGGNNAGGGGDIDGGGNDSATELSVAFASDTPAIYTKGSNVKIKLDVQGDLPAGADILMLHWSTTESQMVDSFAHELSNDPFEVSSAKLDALPSGVGELQALIRVPGEPLSVKKTNIIIIDEGETPDDLVADVETPSAPDTSDVPKTTEGFTDLPLAGDARVIYVSSSQGSDNNDGLSSSRPVKSAAKAISLLRDGKPDRALFKAGDEWTGGLGYWKKSGRSANEKMVIGYYGNGPRPKFNTNGQSLINAGFGETVRHVAFVGLHAYANKRDPNRAGFEFNADKRPKEVRNEGGFMWYAGGGDILVEDCKFEYYKFNIVLQRNAGDSYADGITIRRCIVLNAYGHWDSKYGGHSSGIYASRIKNLRIDECVFDHNGWNERVSGAKRTKFNHNLYIQGDSTDVNVTNSIITRGASHGLQLRCGGDVINNLFARNAIGFFVAVEESHVKRNVVLMSDDITNSEERGFGFEILPTRNAYVENNVVAQKRGSMGAACAINVTYETSSGSKVNSFNVTMRNNKISQWPNEGRNSIEIRTGSAKMTQSGNQVDTGSGGSSNPPWVDPSRDVESYMQSLGKSASLEAFVAGAASRGPGQWLPAFSANGANTWIRQGFDIIPHD